MLMFTRSMLHSMKARKHSATMVHLLSHLDGAVATCHPKAFLKPCQQGAVSFLLTVSHFLHQMKWLCKV